MKVLIVADVLGEENNGTTIACFNLARYLISQGDEVRFLCSDQDKKDDPNYFVVPVRHFGPILDYLISKNNVHLSKPDKKIIRKAIEGVDIVHIMLPFVLGKKTVKLANKLGIPVTAGFHCQAENFTSHLQVMNIHYFNHRLYKRFYKKFYKKVDAIHYPTEFIRRLYEKEVKKKTNSYVISNGVQDIYRPRVVKRTDPELFKILFIGRLSKEKSHKQLIKAVSQSKYKDKIQLYFAGKGPLEKRVLKYAEKCNIRTPIINFMNRDELVNLINSCDLYCHPAEIEIEAISCLEAISCGLVPVINDSKRSATNGFALSEKNLFKNKDTKDLANKIDYWIEHPEEKKECSKQYEGYTEQFRQDDCMRRMREMILEYSQKEKHISTKVSKKKVYYRDELNDDFAGTNIKTKKTPDSYKYYTKNPFSGFAAWFLYYFIARPIVWLMNKWHYHYKVKNKKVLKQCRKQGYFIYANHTALTGDAFTPNLLTHKRNHIIVSPDTISIPGIRNLVTWLGAIPVPSDTETTRSRFLECIRYRIKQGRSITIYPEAHIWPYATIIREYKASSFRYAYDCDAPVYCLTNAWQKRKFSKKPKLVVIVDGPFYVNKELDRKESVEDLRNRVHDNMVKRAKEYSTYPYYTYIKIK